MNGNRPIRIALSGIVIAASYLTVEQRLWAEDMRATASVVTPRIILPVAPTTLVSAGQPSVRTDTSAKSYIFDIAVEHGRLVSKQRVLVVHRNDEVTLHVTTDTADQFHLHGYNLLVELSPGKTAALHFTANLTGRFTYELHKSELELGALEVYP
jgi:heme/copper-type cytochrome/quinol oxidase subunit 2